MRETVAIRENMKQKNDTRQYENYVKRIGEATETESAQKS